jgi:SagB-type dehydrogenase family enzyme
MRDMDQLRQWMKSDFAGRSRERSDQQKGLPYPPLQKPVPAQPAGVIDLPAFDPGLAREEAFPRLVVSRESRRQYNAEPLSLEELAFLLYATQGVKEEVGKGYVTRRTVPSAGARHPFETYLAVNRVDELEPGLYRYLPLSHQLLLLESAGNMPGLLTAASLGQRFVGDAACVFLWSCLPYRAEWRYQHHAHKNMLLDAGHIGQNLYLAVEALGLGTCAVGAYDQRAVDTLLELDGEDEFIVYLAPVGRV